MVRVAIILIVFSAFGCTQREARTGGDDLGITLDSGGSSGDMTFPSPDRGGEVEVEVGGEDAGRDATEDVPIDQNSEDSSGCLMFCDDACVLVYENGDCYCDCGDPDGCAELEYCDCRDSQSCRAVVNGPVCGLDCECEGIACGCPSGIFVGCVDGACPVVGDCMPGSGECDLVIGPGGCPTCECDEPPPPDCAEIDEYCACTDSPGCQPVTNGIDCGYPCECDPDMVCTCWGTELLACQPAHCDPGFGERCDVDHGRCEVRYDDEGCAYCHCVGGDDLCEGLDYCGCFLNPSCEVLSNDCICPCDYECPGYESCDCDCGGGEYLGCRTGE